MLTTGIMHDSLCESNIKTVNFPLDIFGGHVLVYVLRVLYKFPYVRATSNRALSNKEPAIRKMGGLAGYLSKLEAERVSGKLLDISGGIGV